MFDYSKNVTIKGSVMEYRWGNPHTHILILVSPKDSPEMAGTWDVEGAGSNIMARQGWNKLSFQPGDKIVVVGHPLRDGSKGVSLFYAILPDGQRMYQDVTRPPEGQ
jgi:hypothetical protein